MSDIPGPPSVGPWCVTQMMVVNPGSRCLQAILLSGTLWAGPVKCCQASNNRCAPSQF